MLHTGWRKHDLGPFPIPALYAVDLVLGNGPAPCGIPFGQPRLAPAKPAVPGNAPPPLRAGIYNVSTLSHPLKSLDSPGGTSLEEGMSIVDIFMTTIRPSRFPSVLRHTGNNFQAKLAIMLQNGRPNSFGTTSFDLSLIHI